MCFGGSVPTPKPLPQVTEPDAAMLAVRDADRKRRAAAGGFNSTVLTGGAPKPTNSANPLKTLLGQ